MGTTPDCVGRVGRALGFTLQLYFDFSGYSDMALGLARMFDVKFPANFNSPYKATSIIDFWRRWHITLSLFLRDYLYIPLGGSRRGKVGATSISSSRCCSAASGTARAGPLRFGAHGTGCVCA
jgi:D-alanyl-lipoteichoic acid acyltransferase DltB (MBOAT superfamily)